MSKSLGFHLNHTFLSVYRRDIYAAPNGSQRRKLLCFTFLPLVGISFGNLIAARCGDKKALRSTATMTRKPKEKNSSKRARRGPRGLKQAGDTKTNELQEAHRAHTEIERATAEGVRTAAERNRRHAESRRERAEHERDAAEQLRMVAEQARQAMEELRVAADAARDAAVGQRQVVAEMRATVVEYERMLREYQALLRSQKPA